MGNSKKPIDDRNSIAQFFSNASEYVGNENMENIHRAAKELMNQGRL